MRFSSAQSLSESKSKCTTTLYVMKLADDLYLGCYGRRAGREEAFTWPADFSRLR